MTDVTETKDEKIARLEAELATVTLERDEADRLAGSATRNLSYMQEDRQRHERWKDSKRAKHGFSQTVSMDRVWEMVEGKAARTDEAVGLLTLIQSLVQEGGVPRYSVLPGAALNTLVTDINNFLKK